MATLSWLLLGSAGLLALAGILLALRSARRDRAALAALADRRGWSHAKRAGDPLRRLAQRVVPAATAQALKDAFAGPSMAGPFAIAHSPAQRGEPGVSILHIRTPVPSPGLHLAPRSGFRVSSASAGLEQSLGHDRFARLFAVQTADAAFAEDALDWDTCALLVAPQRTIRMDWLGHDLVVAFPLAARTPRGIESLVAWGARLACSLSEAHGRRAGTPHRRGTSTPAPARLPAGVDPFIP